MLLTGCQTVNCLNGGTCTPWLVGESDHRANCSCTEGFDGDTCEIQTTFSFKGDSFITVQSDRQEGYELSFRFKTTLSDSVVAIGQSSSGSSFFTLKLHEGKLKVHSNMLASQKGEDIGDNQQREPHDRREGLHHPREELHRDQGPSAQRVPRSSNSHLPRAAPSAHDLAKRAIAVRASIPILS